MTQLNVPVGFRAVRDGLAKLAMRSTLERVSWFDVCLKTGLVSLYIGIVYLAVVTGAMFNPFGDLRGSNLAAVIILGASIFSTVMLLSTLVRGAFGYEVPAGA